MLLLAIALTACGDVDGEAPSAIDLDGDGFSPGDDCNDGDAAIHPDAGERCNSVDDDCDGDVDEDAVDAIDVFTDADRDGVGGAETRRACQPDEGEATVGGDCDDDDARVHPGAEEMCDGGIDDDCEPSTGDEDAIDTVDYYVDLDGDGFGGGLPLTACEPVAGRIPDGTDCDDTSAAVHPDAREICNGIDDDCDSESTEDGMASVDGASYWSIQQAVDTAPDGATVRICNGTWHENIEITRSVVLEGRGADVSIIDGGDREASVIGVWAEVDVTIRGLTLQNGRGDVLNGASTGGGIQAYAAHSLTVESSVVADNRAYEAGGIFGSREGTASLVDSSVTRNRTTGYGAGGAFFIGWSGSVVDIDGCEFVDNETVDYGGGLYVGDDVDITDSRFEGNQAAKGGGGLVVTSASIASSVITGNSTDGNGGGILAGTGLSTDSVTVVDSSITDNVALVAGGGAFTGMALVSENTDWGEDVTDNDPDDVTVEVYYHDGTVSYAGFGAGASFACERDAGTCE